jgi:amino acid transporter
MRAGDYHSGPIQTINRVGYFGLIILTVGMIVFACYAVKIIRKAENTPYYVYAMFIGLPMVIYPFFFYLIIGSYAQAMSMMCFSGGMLRLIENSMDRFGNGIEVEEPLAAVLGGNERE